MNGSALQDSSNKISIPEKAPRTGAKASRLFRALRRSGMLFDALVISAAMAVAIRIEWHASFDEIIRMWRNEPLSNLLNWKIVAAFGLFAVVLLWTSSHHHGFPPRRRSLLQEQMLNLRDCAVSEIFLVSTLYVTGAETLSRGFVLCFLALVAIGLGLRRLIYRTFPEPARRRNILIIGTDSTAYAVRETLREDPQIGYDFKGFVKLSNSKFNDESDPAELVGTVDALAEHVHNYSVDEVFLTESCSRKIVLKIVRHARELGVTARMIPGHLRSAVDQKNRSRS